MGIIRRLRAHLSQPINNNRGMAMMMAVSAVALMIYLATEVTYDTTVEHVVNGQELNRLKAYYAARGALDLGLLRIKIYQTVRQKIDSMGNNPMAQQLKTSPFIDQIWSFPFQWPFPAEMLGTSATNDLEETKQESLMDSQYLLSIADEGSKIDLNDLMSPSETLKKNAERRLLGIFEEKIENDEEFRKEYGSFRFQELVNHLKDWMSPKWESENGGDKRSAYSEFQAENLPPNRGFRTLGEMRMLPMIDDRLFALLEPRVTLYGLKGVNPNTASAAVLQSIDVGITKEIADKIVAHREKNPFASADDFSSYVAQEGARMAVTNASELPLTFDTMTSFRVTGEGIYAGVSRRITAIVIDINSTAKKIKQFVDEDKKNANPDPNAGTSPSPTPQQNNSTSKNTAERLPKGPPRIVYWSEQ